MWKARIFTLYPEIFPGPLNKGLYGKALSNKIWNLDIINIRDSAKDKHKTVDDTPFGGGSGMLLKPDVGSAFLDPFTADPTIIVFCDVYDIYKNEFYAKCPRSIAKKAEVYLKKSGIGDKAYFGPEAEFFVFDDVKYKNDMHETGFKIDSAEGPYNTGKDYENGNINIYKLTKVMESSNKLMGEYQKAVTGFRVAYLMLMDLIGELDKVNLNN